MFRLPMPTSRTVSTRVLSGVLAVTGALGFALGTAIWNRSDPSAGGGSQPRAAAGTDPVGRGAGLKSAVVKGRTRAAFSKIRQAEKSGMASELIQYLRLVRDTPVGELGELLIRIERELAGDFPGDLLRDSVAERLVDSDPEAAYELLMSGRSEFFSRRYDDDVIEKLAELNLDGTFGRVTSLPRTSRRFNLLCHLVSQQVREDPDATLERIETLPPMDQGRLRSHLIDDRRTPPEFLFQLASKPGGETKVSKKLESAAYRWATRDPDAVLEALNQIEDRAKFASAIEGFGRGWASKDLDEAFEYASRIDSEKMRAKFLKGVGVVALGQMEKLGRERVEEIVGWIGNAAVRRNYTRAIEKQFGRR